MTVHNQPLIGATIDARYRVDAFVARGGMATVYRATDLRLDRTVALKVMHGSLAEDHEFVARFVREARAAAQLSHPAIVGVFDQGEADGFVYLAMEYVDGQTLRDVLKKRGRLTPLEALSVIEPVLEALNAAHNGGFAHRDIKPENVLISTDGRVKVADFGLARAIVTSETSGLTQGLLIGTVAYLAPEQVERGVADARTDVYSAGIVLYESIVGQTPFTGETPMSVAYQHVHAHVPAPSTIRPEIPAEVDELVLTATKQDPNKRFADASDFASSLRTVRALLPVDAQGATAENRTVILDRTESTVTVGPWTTTPVPPAPGAAAAAAAVAATTGSATDVLPAAGMQGPPGGPWVATGGGETTVEQLPAPEPEPETAPAGAGNEPPPPPTEPKRRRPRRFRILIAALVLALIGITAGVGAWAYTKSQIVTVPSLVGMTPADAKATLAPNDVSLTVAGEDFSASVPKGAILLTDPAAGTTIKRGETVTARTSAGPQTVALPKVTGLKQAKAEANLRAIGLTAQSSEEFSDSVAAGVVMSSNPKTGAVVEVGSAVSLVVSKGPPPVTVPSVVAMDRASAVAKLQSLGLKVSVRNQLPVVVVGRVYSQNPSPGTVIPKGSTVTITLV
ncbi:MAG: Stk1 family PASTA domain-containing Ser/Thr kinase [Candidatus Nanopelagicales bacterium]